MKLLTLILSTMVLLSMSTVHAQYAGIDIRDSKIIHIVFHEVLSNFYSIPINTNLKEFSDTQHCIDKVARSFFFWRL